MRLKVWVTLMFLAAASGASAEVVKPPNSGLQLELPAGWTTRVNAGTLVAEPSDRKVYLSIAVLQEAKVNEYVAKWLEGARALTDFQIDVDGKESEVNGLKQTYSVGSGILDGKEIQWDLTIVRGGARVLAVMAMGEGLDGDVVQNVYASIRRLERSASQIKGVVGGSPNDADSAAIYPDEDVPAEGANGQPAEPRDEEAVEEPPPPDDGQGAGTSHGFRQFKVGT
jgi:hypothetical protein